MKFGIRTLIILLFSSVVFAAPNVSSIDFSTLRFDANNLTEFVSLNIPEDATSFQIEVAGNADESYIISDLIDPLGITVVSSSPQGIDLHAEPWASIGVAVGQLASPERSKYSTVPGFVSLLVPNNPSVKILSGEWKFRVQRYQAGRASLPIAARVLIRKNSTISACNLYFPVRLYLTGAKDLQSQIWSAANSSKNSTMKAIIGQVMSVYKSIGINIQVLSISDLDSKWQTPSDGNFEDLITDLEKIFQQNKFEEDAINIVFVKEVPVVGGISLNLPGPFETGSDFRSGIVMPVIVNGEVSSRQMGLFLAHEIGHYLGLEHPANYLGGHTILDDQMTDTLAMGSANLMDAHNNGGDKLSPQQIAVLKKNPLVRCSP